MPSATYAHQDHVRKHRLSWLLAAALVGLALVLVQLVLGPHGTLARAAGTQDISAKALTDHECIDTEWHFVINQLDSPADAPATIHVTWANGASADVPLDKVTGGVAHYRTTANLDSTVTSATSVIYDGWTGQFNLSHGPCDATTPPTSPSTSTSSTTSAPPTTSTPPSTPATSASTSTKPPTSSMSTPPSATTTARTTTAASSSSAATSATSTTAAQAGASSTTSPFVPGPGQTGDLPPGHKFPLTQLLSGLAAALVAVAGGLSMQFLRRHGSHS